jgi:hypothetical protein
MTDENQSVPAAAGERDQEDDDIRPGYDFTDEQLRDARRGKYAGRVRILPSRARPLVESNPEDEPA